MIDLQKTDAIYFSFYKSLNSNLYENEKNDFKEKYWEVYIKNSERIQLKNICISIMYQVYNFN